MIFFVSATLQRTWLVGDTTNVKTLVTCVKGIALYCDRRELSLAAVLAGNDGSERRGNDGAEGSEHDELHDDNRKRRREIKG
jgi:hypothetical protein